MRSIVVLNRVKMNNYYISAIILAAGSSLRMKGKNKLLEKVRYKTMIESIFLQTISSKVDDVTVVVGFESDKILDNLKSYLHKTNVNIIKNKNFIKGLGASLSVGVNSLPKKTTGVLVVLADMHKINTYVINKLIEKFKDNDANKICIPIYKGIRGNPVLLDRSVLKQITSLEGDIGAKEIIKNNKNIIEVNFENDSILFDIDTSEDLRIFNHLDTSN